MIDIILLLVIGVVAYSVGVIRTIKKFERGELIIEEVEEETETLHFHPLTGEQIFPENVIPIYIETSEDGLFVYNRDTNKYMAHGKTPIEVIEMLKSKFPDTIFGTLPDNLEEVGFYDETI
jgi:hypothetical protein